MKIEAFKRVRWIFFGLGNTLIDETRARRHLLRQVARRLRQDGVHTSPFRLAQSLAAAFSRFSADPWDRMLTETLNDAALSRRLLRDLPYPKHLERPYFAALPLVSGLASAGFRLGVIANQSSGTLDRLKAQGIGRYISCCLSSTEVGVAKPDPRIFEMAESVAGGPTDSLLMIGDRIDNDIRPARQRGWLTIRILEHFNKSVE